MRTPAGLLAVLVSAAMLAACSSSSGGGASVPAPAQHSPSPVASPAQVSESFTLLPCPTHSSATTLQIEGCAEHRIVALDRRINAAVRAVFAAAARRARGRVNLAQLAWIAYRKAACESEADRYAGGTLAPVAFAACEVRIDRARLADLRALSGP